MEDMVYQYSGIARTLDPRYRSNVLIVAFSALSFVVAMLVNVGRGIEPVEAGVGAVWVAGCCFIAWILAREIDPDNVETSGVAALLGAGLALILNAEPALIPLMVGVISVRIINRTTGVPPTLWDGLMLLGLVIWSALGEFWLMGIVAAFAYGFEQLLEKPHPQAQLWASLMAVATLVTMFLAQSFGEAIDLRTLPLLLLVFVWHSAVISRMPANFSSTEDRNDKRLNRQRVMAGQTLLLVALILVTVWRGVAGIEGLLALWAAEMAFLLYQTVLIFRK